MAKNHERTELHLNDAGDVIAQSDTPTGPVQLSKLENDILARIRASYQVLYLHTPEMVRAEMLLKNVANRLTQRVTEASHKRMMLVTWDCVHGFTTSVGRDQGENHIPEAFKDMKYLQPHLALDAIIPSIDPRNDARLWPEMCVFAFMSFDDFMKDPRIRERLVHMSARQRLVTATARHPLFIVSAVADLDTKTRPYISVFDIPLPDPVALRNVVDFLTQSVKAHNATRTVRDLTDDEAQSVIDNLAGMTSLEAENVLSRCFLQFGTLAHPDVLRIIKDEKAGIIKKSEVLTYIPEETAANMDELCGFDGYITWLRRRKLSYSTAAKAEKIDTPRGVAVVGIPGTAKSMVAKATCRELGLPGYILDVGALFGSMVGESEKRVREVLRILDAQKGCVLVIDEADKALGNAHQSTGDSGVTRRVFGAILTWLAENQSRTFVIMTLNRTEGIPPETLRAGRFDKLFYTDLPTPAVRRQIFEVHFKKRGVDITALSMTPKLWEDIIEKTESFVGSEIEEAVKESRHMAMAAHGNGVPTPDQLMLAVSGIRPMAATEKAVIEEMLQFCKDKGTPVTGVTSEKSVKPPRKGKGRSIALDEDSASSEDN